MQDDEQRVEGIEVDIKGVAPLHIIVLTRVLHQVLVGDHPREADTHIYSVLYGTVTTEDTAF